MTWELFESDDAVAACPPPDPASPPMPSAARPVMPHAVRPLRRSGAAR